MEQGRTVAAVHQGHGNYCWNEGNGKCLNTPLSFSLNQTLAVDALNDGNFMLKNRQQ